jgi:uncharacterized membrane protein
MAFCGNCGTQVSDGVKFCPSCGTAIVTAAAQQPVQQQPVYQQPVQQQPPNYTQPIVPGAPTQNDIRDAQDNKAMAILAYILFFIPLLTGAHKTSEFVKFHTNQGTVLFIATLAWGVVYWIILAIVNAILIAIGLFGLFVVINAILGLLWFAPAVMCVLGIVNAAQGKMKALPGIGGIAIIK